MYRGLCPPTFSSCRRLGGPSALPYFRFFLMDLIRSHLLVNNVQKHNFLKPLFGALQKICDYPKVCADLSCILKNGLKIFPCFKNY